MTTTDFNEWLTINEPNGIEDAYCLWEATHGESSGIYDASKNNGQLFIKGPSGDTLRLASDKAIKAFQAWIERYNPNADMGWEGSLQFHRGMQKND